MDLRFINNTTRADQQNLFVPKKIASSNLHSAISPLTQLNQSLSKRVSIQDPKAQISQSCRSHWKDASEEEMQNIESILFALTKGAKIKEWSKVGENRYVLKLEKEAKGTHPKIPGTLIIPTELVIEFSESDGQKIMTFPSNKIHAESLFTLGSVSQIQFSGEKVTVGLKLGLIPVTESSTKEKILTLCHQVLWKK